MIKFYQLLLFIVFFNKIAISQTIAFTYTNANGGNGLCNPATINFTPVFTGTPIGFTWTFGNGQTSNSSIPSITFTTGTYIVKLVAVFANQALETTQTIVINPNLTAALTANKNTICKPDTIKFTATTNATNATYTYNFNDGTTPVVTNSPTINHFFANYGTYNVNVVVTNNFGCVNTANYEVEVIRFEINATLNTNTGCAPKLVTFNSNTYLPVGTNISNYALTFGDGTPILNTNSSTIPHNYADSGTYYPSLTITTTSGCSNTFNFSSIILGLKPTIDTAFAKKTTYCGSEIVNFVSKSNFATSYKWNFGDGAISVVTDTTTTHKYATLGTKIVTVTPIYNECEGNPYSFVINIIGVIANYKYKNTCVAKNTFTFTNLSLGNQSSTVWSWGDGSTNTNTINAVHTFPTIGTFNTMLTIADNITGCRDSITFTIYTAIPSLTNPDTFLCRNATTEFQITNNYNNPFNIVTYNTLGLPTTFANGSASSLNTSAVNFGNFTSNFAIINGGSSYCPDTVLLHHPITVRGPITNFIADTLGCTNNNFLITNNSIGYNSLDIIKKWKWTFGITNVIDTMRQPLPFRYVAEGNYIIKLIATDKNGCIDSTSQNVLVRESPFLRIFPRGQSICNSTTITLTAYHTDTLVWQPASAVTCATCDTTFTTPTVTTQIFALASNAVGCTLKDSTTITVNTSFTAITNANAVYACLNDTVKISVTPSNKKVVWSPTTGLANSNAYTNNVKIITDTTTYTALLTDSAGCYSSIAIIKAIAYPAASVNAGKDRIVAYNSPFTITPIYGAGVINYQWTPAANLTCTTCPSPSGQADSARTFIIKTNTINNCTAKDTIAILIECAYANLYMASAFMPNNVSVNKYYYPQTRGIKIIQKFSIYNRYGQVVYEVSNAKPNLRGLGWNGKYKGELQDAGGYVYFLEAICELGETINKKGSFLLLR